MGNGPMNHVGRPNYPAVLLFTNAAATQETAGTYYGDAIASLSDCAVLEFRAATTTVSTAANDTLDIYIQTTLDNSNWFDIVHFTQILGNGGAKIYIAKILAGAAESEFAETATLAAGSVRNIVGDQYRVKYVVVDGTTADFGFTVYASGM